MKKLFFTFLFLLCLSISSYSQVSNYSFTQTAGAYSEITGGTLFDSATSNSGATSLDDVVYLTRSIGFSFNLNGISYSSYNMNTNGQITFGATSPGTTNYTPISSTTAYESCIAGLARDLQGIYGFNATRTLSSTTLTGVTSFAGIVVGKIVAGTGIAAGTRVTAINTGAGTVDISIAATAAGTTTLNCCSGELRSETQGAAGSRVHIIQYKNFQRFSSATLTDNFNFQIRIYETTNVIEVVYGNVVANSTAIAPQVGLRGATNADFNDRTNTTNWSASSAGATNAATMTLSSTVFPTSGQTYRWTPFVLLVNDVGTTAILNPVNGGGSGNQAPVATIKNFGSANQTTPFNITCTISPGGYSNTKSDTLGSGLSKNITFNNANLSANVVYTVTVYTSLAGDQNHANDTQRVTVSLINSNYGNDSGYFYANNLASDQPSWPDYCWKDTSGSKNILVNGLTSAGNTLIGSVDDGYFILSLKGILLSLGLDTTNKYMKYNGVCYDSIFPATNGMVGFTQKFGVTSLSAYQVDGNLAPDNALLPLWHDFDMGTLTFQFQNRLSYKVIGNQLIITYDKVAAFAPENDWVSFQVIIEIVSGCAGSNSNFRYTFADTTGGMTSPAFLTDYLAQYPAATGIVTTFRNYVSGFTYTGAPIPYTGYVSSLNPLLATPSTQMNIKRPLFNLTTGKGLAIEFGPNAANLNKNDCMMLSVSLSLQGPQSNPSPRVRDTVEIYVRDGSGAPYPVIQMNKVLLDSAYNNVGGYSYGKANIQIPKLKENNPVPLYLEIKNRNSVTTWSNLAMTGADTLKYNFTSSVSNTYGGNAILVNGAASVYTGDVDSLHDGCIDLTDLIKVNNAANVFTSGPYVLTDLNYDGIVDLTDVIIVYNNGKLFICEIKPPGAVNAFNIPSANTTPSFVNDRPAVTLPDPYLVTKEEYFRMQNLKEDKK